MKNPKIVLRRAKDGWRWRIKAANGRIVGESGEAYRELRKAIAGLAVAAAIMRQAKPEIIH
jgi:uncharacterized protein YegP (UPF0339 family)